MAKSQFHETDVQLDKAKLRTLLKGREWNFKELWGRLIINYGLDLDYRTFMANVNNDTSWKLIYAYTICKCLDVNIEDLFNLVKVDIEKEKLKREEWNKRYGKEARERRKKEKEKKMAVPSR